MDTLWRHRLRLCIVSLGKNSTWAEHTAIGPWPAWLTIVLRRCDTVGWVIWPVKSSLKWHSVEWDVKPYYTIPILILVLSKFTSYLTACLVNGSVWHNPWLLFCLKEMCIFGFENLSVFRCQHCILWLVEVAYFVILLFCCLNFVERAN